MGFHLKIFIALGVLRMIKLFGWEHKMSEAIKQKRDEELEWIWKDKVRTMNAACNWFKFKWLILTFNISHPVAHFVIRSHEVRLAAFFLTV